MPETLELAELQQVERLQARIKRLRKVNDDYLYEMAERGKAIEELYTLCCGWKRQLPDAFTEKVMRIFETYIDRCTAPCSRNAKKRKENSHANNSNRKT